MLDLLRRIINNLLLFFFVVPTTTETEDAVPISAKHLERIERVSSFISHNYIQVYHWYFQRKQREKRQSEIAAIAKEALKPAFKKRTITKDEYKEIMKKVVTKVCHISIIIFRKTRWRFFFLGYACQWSWSCTNR